MSGVTWCGVNSLLLWVCPTLSLLLYSLITCLAGHTIGLHHHPSRLKILTESATESILNPSRLKILKITTLETRRVRADLLEVFKIINGLDSIFPADFFIMKNEHGKTRGHPYKVRNYTLGLIYEISLSRKG